MIPFRWLLMGSLACPLISPVSLHGEVGKPQEVTQGVWFHEGDLVRKGQCNNGWIIFKDHVLVIDANWPSAAKEILAKIRQTTDKPVRFAFDSVTTMAIMPMATKFGVLRARPSWHTRA